MAGEAFLTVLAVNSNVASSTRNPAPDAMALLYGQILRKGFGLLVGVQRARKPARRPIVFTRDEERAVLARLNRGRCMMGSRLYGSGLLFGGAARQRRRFGSRSLQRFRFRLQAPLSLKDRRGQYATLAPRILGDRGVLLGRQYPSPSHGMTALRRRAASSGPSSAAADIASAGATGAWDWKDRPAPAIVPSYAASGSGAALARRPPLLRSLARVPPTWAYCVESGPK